jgi:Ribonuclease G/E
MKLYSFHNGGKYSARDGYGQIIERYGDRVTILCAETGDLIDVHHRNTQAEPTPEEIKATCEELRKGWPAVRLNRDELYQPLGYKFYDGTNGLTNVGIIEGETERRANHHARHEPAGATRDGG